MLSKALLISKSRQAVNNNKQLLLIINSFEKCISCIGIKDVSVENHNDYYFVAALFYGKPFLGCQIGDKMIISYSRSQTFGNAGSREIGLFLLGSSWLPCLGIGAAVFQTSVNVD